MKVEDLKKALAVVMNIPAATSFSELFRGIELGPQCIRAVSEYGNIEYWIDIPEITTPVRISAASFDSVVRSLPQSADVALTPNATQLDWKCGAARGHWSYLSADAPIPVIVSDGYKFAWVPGTEFAEAMEIASAASQVMTATVGLFGIVVEHIGDPLRISASNTVALSTATVPAGVYAGPAVFTLRPPTQTTLIKFLRAEPTAQVEAVDNVGVFVLSKQFVCHLPLSPPLERALAPVIDAHVAATQTLKINPDAIKQFLIRARGLIEKNSTGEVSLKIANGQIILEHVGLSSRAEEYFLAEGGDPTKTFDSVQLPIKVMISALSHVDTVVLDYLATNRIVLRGVSPDNTQIIGGRAK